MAIREGERVGKKKTKGHKGRPSCGGAPSETPCTKKAARELGYHLEEEWIRKFMVPRKDAKPLVVKGDEFYAEKDCEAIASKTEFGKRGFKLSPDAEPVAEKYSDKARRHYDVYRFSDAVPKRKVREVPPREIDILEAIRVVNRAAKRYRDAARSCYKAKAFKFSTANSEKKGFLYGLKDKGIRRAHGMRLLDLRGAHAGLAVYESQGYCFHSRSVPEGEEDIVECESTPPEVFRIPSRQRGKDEPRLKDAVFTLQSLPDPGGYAELPPPSMKAQRERERLEQQQFAQAMGDGDDEWEEDEEWDDEWLED